jgi:predicted RNase H-like nuclease (RuvC/YqgF family)
LVCDFQVRSLEAQGLPSKQAEAITGAITEVLNDSLGVVSQLVVSKGEMQKAEMTQESNLSKFKSEINSSLDHHFSLLQHENEKLRNDIERIRSDIRHEIDKVTAGQRLDLNLEKGSEKQLPYFSVLRLCLSKLSVICFNDVAGG